MTTDIIERLKPLRHFDDVVEAMAEIELLRKEVERWKNTERQKFQEYVAEIERLRSALRIAMNALRIAAEEVERLYKLQRLEYPSVLIDDLTDAERHTAHERIEAWLAEAAEYEKMEEPTP